MQHTLDLDWLFPLRLSAWIDPTVHGEQNVWDVVDNKPSLPGMEIRSEACTA